jgi:rhodanese-related sulfurtransferase
MTPLEVQDAVKGGAVVLDMRLPKVFAKEHVAGAVNVQFNRADLVDRIELVFPREVRFIVHAEPAAIATLAANLLKEAGLQVEGALDGGLKAWKEARLPTTRLDVLNVDDVNSRLHELQVVDAREPFEYRHGHVPGALLLPWTQAWAKASALSSSRPVAVICGDEVRSALVASVLARTRSDVRLVTGGMVDWNERGFEVAKGDAPFPAA